MQLTDKQLDEVYAWIDSLSFSKPKRNISRDFADGVMLAEIIHHYMPKTIDLHNYPSANSLEAKRKNWVMLNTKVLSKIGLELTNTQIDNLSQSTPLAIENLLYRLKTKVKLDKRLMGLNQIKLVTERQSVKISKVEELRQILQVLKNKVGYLKGINQMKDRQMQQLEEVILTDMTQKK